MPKNTVEVTDEGTFWYKEGTEILHRDDGPAFEYADGSQEWFQNGKRHRLDGPAVEWANGDREWYQNDQLHRLDGPAVERSDGYELFWIHGKQLTKEEFDRRTQVQELSIAEVENLLGYKVKIVDK